MSDQDSTVVRTLIIVFGAFVLSSCSDVADTPQDPRVLAKIEANIKPVAKVNIGDVAPVAVSASVDPKETYQSACFACHGTGAAGAPKLGDKGAWKSRIAQGTSKLYDHAINGFKGMPPKGGRGDLSDDVVNAVVDYMIAESK